MSRLGKVFSFLSCSAVLVALGSLMVHRGEPVPEGQVEYETDKTDPRADGDRAPSLIDSPGGHLETGASSGGENCTLRHLLEKCGIGNTLDAALGILALDSGLNGSALMVSSQGDYTFEFNDRSTTLNIGGKNGTITSFRRICPERTTAESRDFASLNMNERIEIARTKALALVDGLRVRTSAAGSDIQYRVQEAHSRHNEEILQIVVPVMWRDAAMSRVIITVSLICGQVLYYEHTPVRIPARAEVRINSEDAKSIAWNLAQSRRQLSKYYDSKVILGILEPNDFWSEDRKMSSGVQQERGAPVLCWTVLFLLDKNGGRTLGVFVDAETGDIVGGRELEDE